MTMYLPNRDVRPTGAEAGEFIDAPDGAEPEPPAPPRADDDTDESD
jgi:hypothetical protein